MFRMQSQLGLVTVPLIKAGGQSLFSLQIQVEGQNFEYTTCGRLSGYARRQAGIQGEPEQNAAHEKQIAARAIKLNAFFNF
jgi:hypothetical protein